MESYSLEKEKIAIDYLTGAYIKMPRRIFLQMISKSVSERRTGWFHLLLIGLCYHTDGHVTLKNCKISCRRGEYVGSYQHLSEVSGFSINSTRRIINKLTSKGLIDVMRVEGGTRIRVCGYQVIAEAQQTDPGKPFASSPKTPAQLSEASKSLIMRKEDADMNPEIQFF